jgi:hypothetical protein
MGEIEISALAIPFSYCSVLVLFSPFKVKMGNITGAEWLYLIQVFFKPKNLV